MKGGKFLLIRNPQNPYPQNITIDPARTKISFTFSGEKLGSYQIKIYNYPANINVYTSAVFHLPEYVYNGETIQINTLLSNMNVSSAYGDYFTWEVLMSDDISATPLTINNSITSLRYFFGINTRPYVCANAGINWATSTVTINGVVQLYHSEVEIPTLDVLNLTSRIFDLSCYYYGANIKYYYIKLLDNNKNVIEETDKNFSSKIQYTYNGLLPDVPYTLYLYTVSQKDENFTLIINIKSTYDRKIDLVYPPIIQCNPNTSEVKIKWLKDLTSTGRATGSYSFTESQVYIVSGTIVFDNLSKNPIVMDNDNFCVGIKTSINDKTEKIFDYINNGTTYHVYVEDYNIYLRVDNSIPISYGTTRSSIKFGVQDFSTPENDTGYMWYTDETHTMTNSTSSYLLFTNAFSQKFSIILQKDNGTLSCVVQKLT